MLVRGSVRTEVDINIKDAIVAMWSAYGFNGSFRLLDIEHKHNKTGKRALYSIYDMSYYGSSDYDYELITDNEDRVKIYESLMTLARIENVYLG